MRDRPLLLDTHVWIWIVNGDHEIKPSLREKVATALKNATVLVPSICIWEIGMLWKHKRIQLAKPLNTWIQEAIEKAGFNIVPLTDSIALESATLPGDFHNDPADCMIVATARVEDAVLVTRDSRILEYGKAGHVNILQS